MTAPEHAEAFSDTADAYEATMAPALRPVAEEVVRRAALRPSEIILDAGTGTGNALVLAAGEGRRLIGVDVAPGMLELARAKAPEARLIEADFAAVPLSDASVDVVIAVHALLFADDPVAALVEWRRLVAVGGRLSISVPGPGEVVPNAILGPVFDRYGVPWDLDYPRRETLAAWAARASWADIEVDANPTMFIPLRDGEHFRTWLRVRGRGRATADWSAERRDRFATELMEASPRGPDGGYRLPFGALFLTARRS